MTENPRIPLIGLTGRKRSGKNTAAQLIQPDAGRHVAFAEPIKRILMDIDPYVTGERSIDTGDNNIPLWKEKRRLKDALRDAIQAHTVAVLDGTQGLSPQMCLSPQVLLSEAVRTLHPVLREPLGYSGRHPSVFRLSHIIEKIEDFELFKDSEKPVDIEIRRLQQKLGTEVGRELVDRDLWTKTAQTKIEALLADAPGQIVAVTDCRFDDEASTIADMGGHIIEIVRPGLGENTDAHASEKGIHPALVDTTIVNDGTLEDLSKKLFAAIVALT